MTNRTRRILILSLWTVAVVGSQAAVIAFAVHRCVTDSRTEGKP